MATYVITGADRGIGAAMCVALGARGDTVIAACLVDAPALRGRPGVEVVTGIAAGVPVIIHPSDLLADGSAVEPR